MQKLASLAATGAERPDSDERLLWEAILDQVDAETQRIALLRHVDGFTLEEVAELVGLSRKTVAKKLEQFAANARVALSPEGEP
jgi:DNA-directed RNA polymerase specialized sigma24 family protein